MLILSRHILQRHLAPFLFSVLVLVFVFLLQFIMQKMDQLVGTPILTQQLNEP